MREKKNQFSKLKNPHVKFKYHMINTHIKYGQLTKVTWLKQQDIKWSQPFDSV